MLKAFQVFLCVNHFPSSFLSKLKVTVYGEEQFDDAEVCFFNRSEARSSIHTSPEYLQLGSQVLA